MTAIRPGLGVEFIFQSDFIKDNIRALQSIIYEVIGRKIILSQPPSDLLKSSLNQDIIVTYLVRKGDQEIRYGFKAKIIEIMNDYTIAAGQVGQAVAVQQTSMPEHYEIRRFVRVRVPSASGLELYLRGQQMNLIDISLGGAKFSHPELPSLQVDERVRVTLHIDDQTLHLDADIVRVWSPGTTDGSKTTKFGTLKFVNIGKDVEQVLGNKIFIIQRKMLAEGIR